MFFPQRYLRPLLLPALVAALASPLQAQKKNPETVAIGLSAAYNFQTESFGNGLRVAIPLGGDFTLVPQVTYFYPFNAVHELHEQVNLHYTPIRLGNLALYGIAGVSANQWFNYSTSPYKKAQAFSMLAEVGGGALFRMRRLGIFAEQRYNPIWKEGTLHVGALFYFKKHKKRKGGHDCPAYM